MSQDQRQFEREPAPGDVIYTPDTPPYMLMQQLSGKVPGSAFYTHEPLDDKDGLYITLAGSAPDDVREGSILNELIKARAIPNRKVFGERGLIVRSTRPSMNEDGNLTMILGSQNNNVKLEAIKIGDDWDYFYRVFTKDQIVTIVGSTSHWEKPPICTVLYSPRPGVPYSITFRYLVDPRGIASIEEIYHSSENIWNEKEKNMVFKPETIPSMVDINRYLYQVMKGQNGEIPLFPRPEERINRFGVAPSTPYLYHPRKFNIRNGLQHTFQPGQYLVEMAQPWDNTESLAPGEPMWVTLFEPKTGRPHSALVIPHKIEEIPIGQYYPRFNKPVTQISAMISHGTGSTDQTYYRKDVIITQPLHILRDYPAQLVSALILGEG